MALKCAIFFEGPDYSGKSTALNATWEQNGKRVDSFQTNRLVHFPSKDLRDKVFGSEFHFHQNELGPAFLTDIKLELGTSFYSYPNSSRENDRHQVVVCDRGPMSTMVYQNMEPHNAFHVFGWRQDYHYVHYLCTDTLQYDKNGHPQCWINMQGSDRTSELKDIVDSLDSNGKHQFLIDITEKYRELALPYLDHDERWVGDCFVFIYQGYKYHFITDWRGSHNHHLLLAERINRKRMTHREKSYMKELSHSVIEKLLILLEG